MNKKTVPSLVVFNAALVAIDTAAINHLISRSGTPGSPALYALALAALVMSAVSFVYFNLTRLKALYPAPLPEFSLAVDERTTLQTAKAELMGFYRRAPAFAAQINAAVLQIDSMKQKRAALLEILKRNKDDSTDLIKTADETAGIIAENMRHILNGLTVGAGLVPGAKAKEAEVKAEIQNVLDKNHGILSSFDEFLSCATSVKGGVIEEDIGLKAAITALKRMY